MASTRSFFAIGFFRNRRFRSIALRLAAYPAIAYITIGAGFYLEQSKLLFPAPHHFERKTPADDGLPFDDLRLRVTAHDTLHAWWIPAPRPSQSVLLVFHGNGYVLEDMVDDEVPALHALGPNLLLIDYRGYGLSTPIVPNETTISQDANAALDYLSRQRKISLSDIVVLGRSIGSGPATNLALHNSALAGLVLESPFSSIDDAAGSFWYLRLYPVSLMLHTHFDNRTKIHAVKVPVLIVSGTEDTLTPSWMARQLFAAAQQPKQLYLAAGAGHNDLLLSGGRPLERVLQQFLAQVSTHVSPPPATPLRTAAPKALAK